MTERRRGRSAAAPLGPLGAFSISSPQLPQTANYSSSTPSPPPGRAHPQPRSGSPLPPCARACLAPMTWSTTTTSVMPSTCLRQRRSHEVHSAFSSSMDASVSPICALVYFHNAATHLLLSACSRSIYTHPAHSRTISTQPLLHQCYISSTE